MSDVWFDEASGVWLIRLASSAYAFCLADEDTAIQHTHWGGPVDQAAAAELASAARGPPTA